MDLYTKTSYGIAEQLMKRYSTSFSMSSLLFAKDIRPHIAAIYGLVRIADEIVDTYKGDDAEQQLQQLQQEVYRAIQDAYSTNPLVHAFAHTAQQFDIDKELIDPFFDSMRMDLQPQVFTQAMYERYIYGSAEVVGLMCLKVFVAGNQQRYQDLEAGAKALGAAYQKVNFLRDMRTDYEQLGRVYFPDVEFDKFSEQDKRAIIQDITEDIATAQQYLAGLPDNARSAVTASVYYYDALLKKLAATPTKTITQTRVRVPNWQKIALLMRAGAGF